MQSSRETALAAIKKEQRAAALVAELTAMIKEQKARISELNRSKEEMVADLKVGHVYFVPYVLAYILFCLPQVLTLNVPQLTISLILEYIDGA